MNLYRVTFRHWSPKDYEEGIKTYLLAENDEEVYKYVDKTYNNDNWEDYEPENDDDINIYDDDCNIIGTESFKEMIIRIKGEQNWECADLNDLYYGKTLYGWELVKADAVIDFKEMLELGIVVNTNKGEDNAI